MRKEAERDASGGNRQQVSGGELKDHPGPCNHAPQSRASSSSSVNERSHLPAPCLFPFHSPPASISLTHSQNNTMCSECNICPLQEINWPPTKDSQSQITSSEKSAIVIIVTECVEKLFKYVIPQHALSFRGLRIGRYLLTITN